MGFFYKDKIRRLLEADSKKYDIIASLMVVGLTVFCWITCMNENKLYYFDMKPVYYQELISAVLIPCIFGIVLIRLIHWMGKVKRLNGLNHFLAFCGQSTIPIMFMHIPLNYWKNELTYGRGIYMLIGIGIPIVFTILFHKNKIMRILFGCQI